MSAPHNKAKTPEQADALARAREGKRAWNKWIQKPAYEGPTPDFSGYDFTDDPEGPIDFSGFIFPVGTIFSGATFGNLTKFEGAEFRGDARFDGATFGDNACFDNAKINGAANFGEATFEGDAKFSGARFDGIAALFNKATFGGNANFVKATFTNMVAFNDAQFDGAATFHSVEFGGPVYLIGAVFKSVPELRFTKIATHFTLHGVRVEYAKSDERAMWLGLSWAKAAHPDDVDRYRRLKELAMAAKDHEREQEFFALELKAKRHYETQGWALLLNYAYELFSGFGRSVMRPLVGLVGVWFWFGVGHGMFAKLEAGAPWLDGFRLSTAVLLPFVSSARTIYGEASEALYEDAPAQAWALDLAVVTESALGLLFLFLLGLALRNRFRL